MYQYQTYEQPPNLVDQLSSFQPNLYYTDESGEHISNNEQFSMVTSTMDNSSQNYGNVIPYPVANSLSHDPTMYYDDLHLDSLLLSDILKTCPSFSFFDELINIKSIEQANTLLHYDLVKINDSILDISSYLNELILLLENLDTITNNNSPLNRYYDNIEWIYEGKAEIMKISKNVDGIDSIISQLLHIIESKLDETTNDDEFFDEGNDTFEESDFEDDEQPERDNAHNSEKKKQEYLYLLGNFDEISDLSLQVKKYLIVYKKRLDISIQYNELYYQVLDSVNDEIENSLKDCFKTHEVRFSSQVKNINQYDNLRLLERINRILNNLNEHKLELLKRKKSVNSNNSRSILNLSNSSLLSIDSINMEDEHLKYPIFEESEKKLYEDLQNLKVSIEPIKASINYIKPKISNYSTQEEIQEFYPSSIEQLNIKFDSIEEKFIFLVNDLDDLNYELIDKKWYEVLNHLIIINHQRLSVVIDQLETLGILINHDLSGYSTNQPIMIDKHVIIPIESENEIKDVHKNIKIIEKIIDQKLVMETDITEKFIETLLKLWNEKLFNKLPPEFIQDWFGLSHENDSVHHNNYIKHNIYTRQASPEPEDDQPRLRRFMSKRNTVIATAPRVDINKEISQHSKRTSIGSIVSPNTEAPEFQARSFSLSRSNTMNHISSLANDHENVKKVVSPALSNHRSSSVSVASPSVNNDNNSAFGLGLHSFNTMANNTSVSDNPENNIDNIKKEKRHLQRRSLTGSLLIGKMNLQPIIVQNNPTSPEKESDVKKKQATEKNDVRSLRSELSPRTMKSGQFSMITPRMGILANRDFKVLSTVESVADEEASGMMDTSFNSIGNRRNQIVTPIKKIDPFKNNLLEAHENATTSTPNDYMTSMDDSIVSNLSSIENSRLEALKKLENNDNEEIGINENYNILDQLDKLSLHDALPIKSPTFSEGSSRRKSVSKLPITKSMRKSSTSSTNYKLTSPRLANTSHHDFDESEFQGEYSSISMIDNDNSNDNFFRKSSLVPIPISKASRIRSPEKSTFFNDNNEENNIAQRIHKLKKMNDKGLSMIPQPKQSHQQSMMSRSSSSKTMGSDINNNNNNITGGSNVGSRRSSNSGKPKKRNSSSRAKIIAKKEFV